MPTVSVVIPTYNRSTLLVRAVESVLGQSFKDFEIIVVDDASTDDTYSVVRSFRDPRIVYVRNDSNKGVSASRNVGISLSKGEFVAFLDSDDVWLPSKLDKQLLLFSGDSDIGMVYTGEVFVNERGEKIREMVPKYRGYIFNVLLGKNFISPSSVMVRREVFYRVGLFNEELSYREDYELWLRIAKKYKVDAVCEPLTIRYIHTGERLSNNAMERIRSFFYIMDSYRDDFAKNPKALARQYYELGKFYAKVGDSRNARSCFLKSFVTRPGFNAVLKYVATLFR